MVTESMDQPGLYLYKRPVRSPNPDQPNPLTLCGSVYHHCVLYWKMEGGEVRGCWQAPFLSPFSPSMWGPRISEEHLRNEATGTPVPRQVGHR